MNNVNVERFITGMRGVYSVAAELSARGYIVTITARNAPGIDIIASTSDMKKSFNIQVKANKSHGTQSFWLLNKEAKRTISSIFFYIFVNFKEDKNPDFYIVKSKIVAKNLDISHTKRGVWYSFERDERYLNNWNVLK